MHRITMLGTGLIGRFYALTLIGNRSRDELTVVYSRTAGNAEKAAAEWGAQRWTSDMNDAIRDPDTDIVVVALPNALHKEAVIAAANAGKAVLCTKPLATNAADAGEMLEAVEHAGVFHGYLEDLVYTPKTLKAAESVRNGALGRILWTRSREAHPGPHSAWFWDREMAGGGAIVDMGCHCIEIGRTMIGKQHRPLEVMCWGDTQVHPIEVEDSAVGLVRYEGGAIAQFEVSWNYRGGMDLRDEVSGTDGTIMLNHWLRTGFEMFTTTGEKGYVAEKAEGDTGWLFPVGDELGALGYVPMFTDMLDALDSGRKPRETFYDGYVVNAVIEACYRSIQSKKWEQINLDMWRGGSESGPAAEMKEYDSEHLLVKEELMPDGRKKFILKEKTSGKIIEKYV
mgnify:CR=1 FL=1